MYALLILLGGALGYSVGRRRGVRLGLEQRLSTVIPREWSGTRQLRRAFSRGAAAAIASRRRPAPPNPEVRP